VRDQVKLARVQTEVLAPPFGADDGLTGERGDGRIEGLEHGQRRDVDPTDGQSNGVTAEVVGKGFDLG
jgi:hypothetical protein